MTKEQRRQAIDFGKIRGTGMPVPIGTIGASSRYHVVNLYFEAPVAGQIFWRNRNLVGTGWGKKSLPAESWVGRKSPASGWRNRGTPQDGNTQVI